MPQIKKYFYRENIFSRQTQSPESIFDNKRI